MASGVPPQAATVEVSSSSEPPQAPPPSTRRLRQAQAHLARADRRVRWVRRAFTLTGVFSLLTFFVSTPLLLAFAEEWNLSAAFYYSVQAGLGIGFGALRPFGTEAKVVILVQLVVGTLLCAFVVSFLIGKELGRADTAASTYAASVSAPALSAGLKWRVPALAGVLLLGILAVGVLYGTVYEEWSVLDSLLFVVSGCQTSGLVAPSVRTRPGADRFPPLFNTALFLAGVPIWGFAFGQVVQLCVDIEQRRVCIAKVVQRELDAAHRKAHRTAARRRAAAAAASASLPAAALPAARGATAVSREEAAATLATGPLVAGVVRAGAGGGGGEGGGVLVPPGQGRGAPDTPEPAAAAAHPADVGSSGDDEDPPPLKGGEGERGEGGHGGSDESDFDEQDLLDRHMFLEAWLLRTGLVEAPVIDAIHREFEGLWRVEVEEADTAAAENAAARGGRRLTAPGPPNGGSGPGEEDMRGAVPVEERVEDRAAAAAAGWTKAVVSEAALRRRLAALDREAEGPGIERELEEGELGAAAAAAAAAAMSFGPSLAEYTDRVPVPHLPASLDLRAPLSRSLGRLAPGFPRRRPPQSSSRGVS